MRKTLLSILAAILLGLGFTSCEHQTMDSMEVTIRATDWVQPVNTNYYIATVAWDALNEDVVDFGTVNAYLIENGRQNLLPYVYPVDYSTYDANGNLVGEPNYIAENLRFDYTYGKISFIMQDMDNNPPTGTFPDMTFRVVALGD